MKFEISEPHVRWNPHGGSFDPCMRHKLRDAGDDEEIQCLLPSVKPRSYRRCDDVDARCRHLVQCSNGDGASFSS